MNQITQVLLDNLVNVLSAALLTAATTSLAVLTRWLHSKYKIDLSEATRSELGSIAQDAVDATAEAARTVIKRVTTTPGTNEKPMTSEEKLHFAVGLVMDAAKTHKLTRARAESLVLSAVADARKWESSK